MRYRLSGPALACGAFALLGVAVAGARAARKREFTLSPPDTPDTPDTQEPSEPARHWLRSGLRAVRFDGGRARRDSQKERVEALSRRKQDFLGLLSHELRNPLSAIHAALAVMRAREGMQTGQRARTVIERQVDHIGRLVEDLVDTARIERGTLSLQLEPVDVRDVLSTAVEMAQPSMSFRQQTLTWEPHHDAMLVNGDRVRLQQVFSNLLLNASKYSPEKGQIALITSRTGSDFCVEVRDNGLGIAAEDLSRVFEPFVRGVSTEPGLGVGLYVARTLIEQHSGEIHVESNGLDAGATFIVRLPELSPLFTQVSTTG